MQKLIGDNQRIISLIKKYEIIKESILNKLTKNLDTNFSIKLPYIPIKVTPNDNLSRSANKLDLSR